MVNPSMRDLPRVLTLKNLMTAESLCLAGVTTIPKGGTITLELFKVNEMKRMLVYQSIMNCERSKALEIIPEVPAPSAEASSPVSVAGSDTQVVLTAPVVAEAPTETALGNIEDVAKKAAQDDLDAMVIADLVAAAANTPPAPPAPPVETIPVPAPPAPIASADPADLGL